MGWGWVCGQTPIAGFIRVGFDWVLCGSLGWWMVGGEVGGWVRGWMLWVRAVTFGAVRRALLAEL